MTLNDLKDMVDLLVEEGHGDKELRMDTKPDVEFIIDLVEYRKDDVWGPFIGVATNDNH